MNQIHPIKPVEINSNPRLNTPIEYFNEKLLKQDWHEEIFVKNENYHAIIITPAYAFEGIMDDVIKEFKQAGWDCFYGSAYDARGPHRCFYVNKNHFNK